MCQQGDGSQLWPSEWISMFCLPLMPETAAVAETSIGAGKTFWVRAIRRAFSVARSAAVLLLHRFSVSDLSRRRMDNNDKQTVLCKHD